MVEMTSRSDFTEWLAENPKMMGAFWMVMLLIAEAGNALAGSPKTGP